eukprot:TRINITY_DN61254_c0_g1_i1.p1 TRINITY_DN61254_c0_g1~~TRINITY_DN61254_c0_g1_i1.p1  ORF type:complete len:461 (+),score=19.57 TRINITY_DN61254_c0_g1_i1:52-1434(+)
MSTDNNNNITDDDEDYGEIPDSEKTPVTIVTGFLGAGKTTLVNYILKEQNTWKICVVENEFGEVPIDDTLVEDNMAAKEDVITMDNGCVCCSIRGDLVRTFGTLVHKRKSFDAIILETTGLADPSPIVFTFNSNAILQDNFRIDSVVCLVDAKHINLHLDEIKPEGDINEAERQVAFADRIMVNKIDLVSKDELEDVIDRIKSMNSFASIIKSERSRVPLDKVLGLSTFSLEKVVEVDPTIMEADEEPEHSHDHQHGEHCSHNCTIDHSHEHHHTHDEHCPTDCDKGHSHEHDHTHDEHCPTDCDKGHSHEHHHTHDEHCPTDCDKGHSHEHDHNHSTKKIKKKHNLSLVSSVGFTIENGLLDVMLFNTFMSELLKNKAADMYRTKGVLAFKDQGDTKFVFQGVHEQITFGPSSTPWGKDEVRISKMVFIGKNLDYEFLKEELRKCADGNDAKVTMHKRA